MLTAADQSSNRVQMGVRRAGTVTPYFTGTGEDALKKAGWYGGENGPSKGRTQTVGKLEANPWNLSDVHGNVWQWCEDRYGPYASGDHTDPKLQSSENSRVLRGGSCPSTLSTAAPPPAAELIPRVVATTSGSACVSAWTELLFTV